MAAKMMIDKQSGPVRRWEYDETISAGATGDWVVVPTEVTAVLVALIPASGASGRVEYTLEGIDSVLAGTATGRAWDKGTVSAYADDTLFPITAIRGVSTAGILRMVGGAS